MKIGYRYLILVLLLWQPYSLQAQAPMPVPALKAPVMDLTGTLTSMQQAALTSRLHDFEASTGAQIAVLMVPSTQPETIEAYSIRVAEAWKLGRKGKDDGLLLLIAKNDRRVRIEVGYGLEGVIPDVIAKRIVSETITPHFQRGEYYTGIKAGLDAIMAQIQSPGTQPPPAPAAKPADEPDNGLITLLFAMLFLCLSPLARIFQGNPVAAGVAAGLSAVVTAWLGGLMLAVIVALVVFIVLIAGGGGGFMIGGFGGFPGSYGPGYRRDDGFRGGGGGFGGGGASGGW